MRQFKPVSTKKLIQYAEDHLQMVHQWKDADHPGLMSSVFEYSSKAEAVIEILEWSLHGNHGAVDKGQNYTPNLRSRLDWIIKQTK